MKKSIFWIVNTVWAVLLGIILWDDFETTEAWHRSLCSDAKNLGKRFEADIKVMSWHAKGLIPDDEYEEYKKAINKYDNL